MNLIKLSFLTLILMVISNPATARMNINSADYIVIGVGTAGGLMAKRLSDDPSTSVIALHDGENLSEDPLIKLSRNAVITVPALIVGPPLYQNGLTTKQPNADNRKLLWGRALPEGGASAVNAGAYCRGTNELYAQWEEIAGPKWSVKRVLRIYKELEDYHGSTPNPKARGHHGPISVLQENDFPEVSATLTDAIIDATGCPFVDDYNDPETPIGASLALQYTHSGPKGVYRVSSATAFLNGNVVTPSGFGVNGRKLRILYNSFALRTIWNEKKAIGVEYIQDGVYRTVFAKKGIIVCGGLFSSAFLMHSGVGPKNLLKSLNIPVVYNNPNVGKGLVDQPALRLVFTSDPEDFPEEPQNGLFASIAWLPTPGGDPNIRTVRIASINQFPGIMLVLLDLVQPLSRGEITIASSDPRVAPKINLGTFTNSDDLNLFISAMQNYIKQINIDIQTINPLYEMVYPDPAILDDTAALTDFIRENVACNQHFQSHCRMASESEGGVVDSAGKVYGVENLFVADDSIVPLCMDGSPMASAYLIAENIVRQIQEE